MTDHVELERARVALAEAEALVAEGRGGPYAGQNVETHRARVRRLQAVAGAIASHAPPITPVAAIAKPTTSIITGTREDRIRRLAAAWGASHDELAAAIDGDMSVEAFALQVADGSTAVDRLVARILAA